MKIRVGFISNSSSSSFILAIRNNIVDDISAYLDNHECDIQRFIEGPKLYTEWELMEEWNIPFNRKTILDTIKDHAEPLDEEGLEIIIHSIDSELAEFMDSEYIEQFKNEVMNQKVDGLKLYQVFLNHSDLPEKFIIDFFMHHMNDDVKEKNFYMRYLPWEY